MLTALQIGNFKAFAETQRIPVRPLTLIYPGFLTSPLKAAGFRGFKGFEAGCLPWFQE